MPNTHLLDSNEVIFGANVSFRDLKLPRDRFEWNRPFRDVSLTASSSLQSESYINITTQYHKEASFRLKQNDERTSHTVASE